MSAVCVSTPSRICLFGEHQDYLGLEVIASAIDLRFSASATRRKDSLLNIRIRDERISGLNEENAGGSYNTYTIDLSAPIVYSGKRDYFRSAVNVLRRKGFPVHGADITMDSSIPIGKGMCSSTTMVLVFMKALMELFEYAGWEDPFFMAELAWEAEVGEFGEPGGRMDHYTSALGGLVHLNFAEGKTVANRLDVTLPGVFILFDSLQQKDTIKVLSDSKYPTQEGLRQLSQFGVHSIRDFIEKPELTAHLDALDPVIRRKVEANIDNYKIQRKALAMLESGKIDEERFGELLRRHHANLRDGLNISTPIIEAILDKAYETGALGGKFNGSGGGGCLYVYAAAEKAPAILAAVAEMGYPGRILRVDRGLSVDNVL